MRNLLLILSFALLIIVGAFFVRNKSANPSPSISSLNINSVQPSQSNNPQDLSKSRVTTFAQNLEIPWAIAFLPSGDLLVTERAGRIRLVTKDGNLLPDPILNVDEVKHEGEGGLMGITLHPDYPAQNFIYIYYTYSTSGNNTLNKVARFTFDGSTATKSTTILDNIPGAIFHNGGRIKFGPDKMLYVTTGDATNPSLSQNKTSLAGKILRITADGKPAPDNQFSNEVYSLGHRNPQGIAWDNKGTLFASEHGQSATDEFNQIELGKNYGWPDIRGDQEGAGLMKPLVHSGNSTWAPSGMDYSNGNFYFAGLKGAALYKVSFENGQPKLTEHFKNQFGRIREVVLGPDNFLYITTSNKDGRGNPQINDDKILKVNPSLL